MQQRTPLDGCKSFDPQTLKVLTQAFDEAWPSIASRCKSYLNIQAGRERLATILLDLGFRGERDVEVLKAHALELFEQYEKHAAC
jgi:hypothetical protein